IYSSHVRRCLWRRLSPPGVVPGAGNGSSSSSLTTPARSQTSSLSLDTGSLAGVDGRSSMSSPLGGQFSDFSGSGFSNDSFGSSATSDEALHRVNSLSQQLVALKNTVQKLVSAVSTLTDAVRNPANPNEAFWMREGYTSYFRQPREKPPSALFQAYDKYSKELSKASASRPSPEDIRKHINTFMGTSTAV
ncbi:hypothetical protein B0H14DRAFT_278068, partial [Mycena olivaceomarginata]